MKVFVLLLMSLLMVNCGIEEPVGESSANYESETDSTAKKVAKYTVYTVAGVGVLLCVNAGLKKTCVKTVKGAFIPEKVVKQVPFTEALEQGSKEATKIKKIAEDAGKEVEVETVDVFVRDYSSTFYGKLWTKVKGVFKKSKKSGKEAAESSDEAADSVDEATDAAKDGDKAAS